MKFTNRQEAGQLLAEQIRSLGPPHSLFLLAISKGGVMVGYEIARLLGFQIDWLNIRRIELPNDQEKTMGAVGPEGACWLNYDLIEEYEVPLVEVFGAEMRSLQDLKREELHFGEQQCLEELKGKAVLLVDDGMATGTTVRMALNLLAEARIGWRGVAVPVAPARAAHMIEESISAFYSILAPPKVVSIEDWYLDFPEISDQEVIEHLNQIKESIGSTRERKITLD